MYVQAAQDRRNRHISNIQCLVTHVPLTIYSFPSLEPKALESWSTKHLHLPLRRDILHLAVVFEGDNLACICVILP